MGDGKDKNIIVLFHFVSYNIHHGQKKEKSLEEIYLKTNLQRGAHEAQAKKGQRAKN